MAPQPFPSTAQATSASSSSGTMRATFRAGTAFGSYKRRLAYHDKVGSLSPSLIPSQRADESEADWRKRRQSMPPALKNLIHEKEQLTLQVARLAEDVEARDERLRLARNAGDAQASIVEEELRAAEAELAALEERRAHEDAVARAHMESLQHQASLDEGASAMLTEAHADRFYAEQRLHDEQLGRREDMAHMHDELHKLKHHLDGEMRRGLEAFREQYKEMAEEQLNAEAKDALKRRFEYEMAASKEHNWAATWQDRYHALKEAADADRRTLQMAEQAQVDQAQQIVRLKRRVGALAASEAREEALRDALASSEHSVDGLRGELEVAQQKLEREVRGAARAKHEAERARLLHSRPRDPKAVTRQANGLLTGAPPPRPALIGALAEEHALFAPPATAESDAGQSVLEAIWRYAQAEETGYVSLAAAQPPPPDTTPADTRAASPAATATPAPATPASPFASPASPLTVTFAPIFAPASTFASTFAPATSGTYPPRAASGFRWPESPYSPTTASRHSGISPPKYRRPASVPLADASPSLSSIYPWAAPATDAAPSSCPARRGQTAAQLMVLNSLQHHGGGGGGGSGKKVAVARPSLLSASPGEHVMHRMSPSASQPTLPLAASGESLKRPASSGPVRVLQYSAGRGRPASAVTRSPSAAGLLSKGGSGGRSTAASLARPPSPPPPPPPPSPPTRSSTGQHRAAQQQQNRARNLNEMMQQRRQSPPHARGSYAELAAVAQIYALGASAPLEPSAKPPPRGGSVRQPTSAGSRPTSTTPTAKGGGAALGSPLSSWRQRPMT